MTKKTQRLGGTTKEWGKVQRSPLRGECPLQAGVIFTELWWNR